MNLLDIVERDPSPAPWAEGDNIPWNEPGFSARMLREHLNQEHDLASRRGATVERHVEWIARAVLGPPPARVLDLGCGPGLYLQRLAQLGHRCRGIDFSPSAVAYARSRAAEAGLSISYEEADLRGAPFEEGGPYDLVMQIFGEINVFRPADARSILKRAAAALRPGGRLLLEVASEEAVRKMGAAAPSWWTAPHGLFGDEPHLMLSEACWDEASRTATMRYFRVDAATGVATRWASTQQAYSEAEYVALLEECGLSRARLLPALGREDGEPDGQYRVLLAERA